MSLAMLACAVSLFASGAHAAQWKFERIADTGQGNRKSPLRIGKDGTAYVAFTGCGGTRCSKNVLALAEKPAASASWTVTRVDESGKDNGWFPALEIDSSGALDILYGDHDKTRLKRATRPAGGKWTTETAGKGNGGYWISSARAGDRLWFAQTRFENDSLAGAWLQVGALDGDRWAFEDVDVSHEAGWFTAMALAPSGEPVVTYMQGGYPYGVLKVATRTAQGWVREALDENVSKSAVTVDPLGFAHVAYNRLDRMNSTPKNAVADLYYATNSPDGIWRSTLVDDGGSTTGDTGYHPSIVLDPRGGIHIAYRNYEKGRLMYARNLGAGWEVSMPYPQGVGGLYPSLAFDRDGALHVVHENGSELFHGSCVDCQQ